MKKFFSKLDKDKIKINWNKKPIKMKLFLSFLTIETETGSGHLGYDNGWTRHYGDNSLQIGGGIVGEVEYLDTIQYGKNMGNPYNNYVNPFYLFDIMNDKGKSFFIEYYSEEIQKELNSASKAFINSKEYKESLFDFWSGLGVIKNE